MTTWTASSLAHYLCKNPRYVKTGSNWLTLCPCHTDGGPSLSVMENAEKRVIINCLAGCDFKDVSRALRQKGIDLRPGKTNKPIAGYKPPSVPEKKINYAEEWEYAPHLADEKTFNTSMLKEREKNITAKWAWRDKDGKLLFYTIRLDEPNGKQIMPITPRQNKRTKQVRWMALGPEGLRPLYNLENLRDQNLVLFLEGEKSVESAKKIFNKYENIWITTTPNGSKSAHLVEWSAIAGRKVIICHDYDSVGLSYAAMVAKNCLKANATECRLMTLRPNQTVENNQIVQRTTPIKRGYDIADAQEEGWNATSILMQNIPWTGPKILLTP